MLRALLGLAIAIALLLVGPTAAAHGMRTAFVDIVETAPGRAIASVRRPPQAEGVVLEPLSERCSSTATTVTCDGPLAGATLLVRGLGPSASEAIVRVALVDGTATHVVTATSPSWTLPRASSPLDVLGDYAKLGAVHIATGADHLLFLLMLVLLLKRPRAVLLAETAFTISHCFSFTATALEWVRVSAAAAEACIAASLVMVALDAAKQERARVGATVGMAFAFGLVHGLGFAGGLREIGLPERDVASALVGFAGGVEVGQVAFVLVVLGLVALAERARLLARVTQLASYGTGGVASFWFLERLVVVLQR
jgi:hydrogenase/urease accessory protein HupE